MIYTYLRFNILECELIDFTIPNLSLICISKSLRRAFKTGVSVQSNPSNLCLQISNYKDYFLAEKLGLDVSIKAYWYTI